MGLSYPQHGMGINPRPYTVQPMLYKVHKHIYSCAFFVGQCIAWLTDLGAGYDVKAESCVAILLTADRVERMKGVRLSEQLYLSIVRRETCTMLEMGEKNQCVFVMMHLLLFTEHK